MSYRSETSNEFFNHYNAMRLSKSLQKFSTIQDSVFMNSVKNKIILIKCHLVNLIVFY